MEHKYCKECGVKLTDNYGVVHLPTCCYARKCEECGVRVDFPVNDSVFHLPSVLHLPTCCYARKCEECGVRVDLCDDYGVFHSSTCKFKNIFYRPSFVHQTQMNNINVVKTIHFVEKEQKL